MNQFTMFFLAFQLIGTLILMITMDAILIESKGIKYKVLYYTIHLFINTFVFLVVKIPIIQFITTSAAIYLLTYAYVCNTSMRIDAAIIILTTLTVSEFLMVLISGVFDFYWYRTPQIDTYFAFILVLILRLLIYFLVKRYKIYGIKNIEKNPRRIMLILPYILVTVLTIIMTQSLEHPITRLLIGSLGLMIIIIILYSYSLIIKSTKDKYEMEFIRIQNELYKKELDLLNYQNEKTMKLRHDFKNMVIMINDLVEGNKIDEIQQVLNKYYISELGTSYVNTSNRDVDSLLNYKIGEMKNQDIKPNLDILVPATPFIDAYDFFVLLGNLLDNAIEANLKLKVNRWIDIRIALKEQLLIIEVTNPVKHDLEIKDAKYITTTKNDTGHGYGLKSIDEIVKKYNGSFVLEQDDRTINAKIKLIVNT